MPEGGNQSDSSNEQTKQLHRAQKVHGQPERYQPMKLLTKALSIALILTSATVFAATDEALLASHFMASHVAIVEAKAPADLTLAQYSEEGPTVAVIVAQSKSEVMYLAEINDIGAILVVLHRDTSEVTTILQAHTISCGEISSFFLVDDQVESVCRRTLQ